MINSQPQLLQIPLDPGDVVYTPDWVARDMVEFFKPSGRILEPCAGDGVFLKHLPAFTEWCEIQEGRDFFKWAEPVDWIIGNPPYADYAKFIKHSMEIADHICYLIPANKPFNSGKMLLDWIKWGRIIHMRYYGTGAKLDFPIGFGIAAVYFQRGYTGPMYTTIYSAPTTPKQVV